MSVHTDNTLPLDVCALFLWNPFFPSVHTETLSSPQIDCLWPCFCCYIDKNDPISYGSSSLSLPFILPFSVSPPVPASIYKVSEDITVNEGSNVTLSCLADGRPDPVINWRLLNPSGRLQPISSQVSHVVFIGEMFHHRLLSMSLFLLPWCWWSCSVHECVRVTGMMWSKSRFWVSREEWCLTWSGCNWQHHPNRPQSVW